MKQKELTSPSGSRFVIRERTGADDDKISRANVDDVKLVNTYVSDVIVEGPGGKRMSPEDIKQLRLRDKYFLVIASRIHSLGPILYFSYNWGANMPDQEYEVDLTTFVWDYSKEFPELGHSEYSEDRFRPYNEDVLEFELSTGQKVAFEYMTGVGESYLIKLPPSSQTANKELIARKIKVHDGTNWKEVMNFGVFSAREMVEIRAKVESLDPQDQGMITIQSPMDGSTQEVPLLGIKDFFYPVKI